MKALKVIGKVMLIFLPVIAIWVFLAAFPMNYMDGEYSLYNQTKDYIYGETTLEPSDIIILGDSKAKSGVLPSRLSESCFNLAQGGSTSVEAYYTLKNYIEHMGIPKTVILSESAYHFSSFDGFWSRDIYFSFLNPKEACEVIDKAGELEEEAFLNSNGEQGKLTLLEYRIKSPTKYMSALVNSFKEDRLTINHSAYEDMVNRKGFKTFVSWWPTSGEYDMEHLTILRTLDYYYRKTINLCIENGIEVYSLNMPLIATTYEECENIWRPFSEYFIQLKKDYAGFDNVHIDTEFASYDEKYFDDADHLNEDGAIVYTDSLKEMILGEVEQ
ncbi:MAG: hypothetical protein MJ092_05005 [Lachnospiraceae bacterium]|nr:hypothetical protein [Lachnospiraceae bacterium]